MQNRIITSIRELRYFGLMEAGNNDPSNYFYNCEHLSVVYGGKFLRIGSQNAAVMNTLLVYMFFPRAKYAQGWYFRGASATLKVVDLGWYSGSVATIFNYKDFFQRQDWRLIIRSSSFLNIGAKVNTNARYYGILFVPEDLVETYQADQYWGTSTGVTISAIGGELWAETFGSSSEYANVNMYAPELYDYYYEDYEAGKLASAVE